MTWNKNRATTDRARRARIRKTMQANGRPEWHIEQVLAQDRVASLARRLADERRVVVDDDACPACGAHALALHTEIFGDSGYRKLRCMCGTTFDRRWNNAKENA